MRLKDTKNLNCIIVFIHVFFLLWIKLGKIIDQKVLRLFIFIPQYEREG